MSSDQGRKPYLDFYDTYGDGRDFQSVMDSVDKNILLRLNPTRDSEFEKPYMSAERLA